MVSIKKSDSSDRNDVDDLVTLIDGGRGVSVAVEGKPGILHSGLIMICTAASRNAGRSVPVMD